MTVSDNFQFRNSDNLAAERAAAEAVAAEAVALGGVASPSGDGSPLLSNRGVEFLELAVHNGQTLPDDGDMVARMHTLTLTVYADDDYVREWYAGMVGIDSEALGWRWIDGSNRFFRGRWRCPLTGAQVHVDHISGEHFVSVEIPGSAADVIGVPRLFRGLRVLRDHGVVFRASRVDIALDVPAELVTAAGVAEHVQREKTGVKAIRSLVKRNKISLRAPVMGGRGATVYFGGRQSERMLRVYDKDLEDGTAVTRFELEAKGRRAAYLLAALLDDGLSRFGQSVIAHMRDYIDFLGADWWDAIVSGVARAAMTVSQAGAATVERARRWVEKQVAPALAMVVEAMKADGQGGYLERLLMQGKRRLNDEQRAALAGIGVI